MEFIVQGESYENKTLATFYSGKNYAGESQALGQGLYNYRQLAIGEPQSVKLEENGTFLMAEKADGSGLKNFTSESLPDLSVLSFKPAVFTLVNTVAAYKDGVQVTRLNPGGYELSVLLENGVDKLVIPEGLIARFANGENDENAKSFKAGEVPFSKELLKFSHIFVVIVWHQADLSEAELAMVAGGKCSVDVCTGRVCAADLGIPVEVCSGKACAFNIVPGLPVSI